eukprot:364431-Chlamydomonas_euryale.AAC.2
MSLWENVHALVDEDRFKSMASQVFSDAKTAFAHNPPQHAQRRIIPHHALLASFGVASSVMGTNFLRYGRILLRC